MEAEVYKVELLIVDIENCGEGEVRHLLENVKYLHPEVLSIESRKIKWDDYHALNHPETREQAYRELFNIRRFE